MNCHARSCLSVALTWLLMNPVICCAHDGQLTAKELIDRAMRAQLAAQKADTSRFEYRFDELDNKETVTYRMVESDAGNVQQKVAVSHKELTPQQREREEQQFKKLLGIWQPVVVLSAGGSIAPSPAMDTGVEGSCGWFLPYPVALASSQ